MFFFLKKKKYFFKKIYFLFEIYFLMFLDRFNILMSKIIFKKYIKILF
jgi:hypothetical protein